MSIKEFDIKSDMPLVEEARERLMQIIRSERQKRTKIIKIIHGYGSTGVGGKIRQAVRKSLQLRKKEGIIKDFIFGENFSPFDPTVQKLAFPEFSHDRDYCRNNPGITIVVLNYP